MRRTRSRCCARVASGQVAAPPSSVMNRRRRRSNIRQPLCSGFAAGQSTPPSICCGGRQVLGASLNCSETGAGCGRIQQALGRQLRRDRSQRHGQSLHKDEPCGAYATNPVDADTRTCPRSSPSCSDSSCRSSSYSSRHFVSGSRVRCRTDFLSNQILANGGL